MFQFSPLDSVFHACRAACLVVLCGLFAAFAAHAGELRIGGTGSTLGTMRLLGEAFSKEHPGIKVVILKSTGSAGAAKGVARGLIDIGLSSRPLDDSERANGLLVVEYARSPTVLAVSNTLKVHAISRAQLAEIFSGRLDHWPDGTPIRPIMRRAGDGNSIDLKRLSPAIDLALGEAEQRPGLAHAANDQDAANKIANIPGAIGVSTVAQINSERRPLRALKLDGVEPTPANAASGRYPIHKRFYYVTRQKPSNTVNEFIAFLQSPAAREILAQTGHWLP